MERKMEDIARMYYTPYSVKKFQSEDNPRVFLDISVNGDPPERLEIELFSNVVPLTAENFRALCTGEKGIGKTTKLPLHYKGTVFTSIYENFIAVAGAISGDTFVGESIYGGYFKDENFELRHSEPGMLAMKHHGGPDTNGSLFHITLTPQPVYDGLCVVFGKVIKGMSAFYLVDHQSVVQIVDCGEISQGTKKTSLNGASSSDGAKEHSDEREKQKKCLLSEGLLQILDRGEIDQDRGFQREHPGQQVRNDSIMKLRQEIDWMRAPIRELVGDDNTMKHPGQQVRNDRLMKLRQQIDWMMASFRKQVGDDTIMEHPRQQVGDDTIMELRLQIDWITASIREISRSSDFHIPSYPLLSLQQGRRGQD